MTKSESSIAREAEAFEATLKSAQVPDALHDGFWDLWTVNPARARALAQRLAPPPRVATTKANTPAPEAAKPATKAAPAKRRTLGDLLDGVSAELLKQRG